jgi:hypothetical protein
LRYIHAASLGLVIDNPPFDKSGDPWETTRQQNGPILLGTGRPGAPRSPLACELVRVSFVSAA